MSRPIPGAESELRRGFPDAVQKKILIIYGAIFGVGVLYAFLILHTPFRIPCLFREVTGLQCPGCRIFRTSENLARSKDPSADPLHQYRDLYDFCDFSKSATLWLNPLFPVNFYIFYPGFNVFRLSMIDFCE